MKQHYYFLLLFLFSIISYSQSITVNTTTYTVPQLVQDVLIDSPCALVSNFTSSNTCGIGYFQYGGSNFDFPAGMILRNGTAASTAGQYTGNNMSTTCSGSSATDADLQNFSNLSGQTGTIQDVTYVQFDFTPLTDSFSFNFVFASNEYGTFQCSFADVFAFVLTDLTTGTVTNLAVIPGTTTPVSVVNIRDMANNGTCASVNPLFFDTYNVGLPAASTVMNMRGYTVPMTAAATVIPNNNYRIKLAIGDYNDTAFDSAVFIEAGSFNVGTANLTYPVGVGFETADLTVANGFALCPGDTKLLDSGLDPADYNFVWTLDTGSGPTVLAGETSETLLVTQPGTYCVEASNVSGGSCIQNDCIIVEYLTGITINNPATDLLSCDENFNLDDNIPAILGPLDPFNYDILYFLTAQDAIDNANQISSTFVDTNPPTTIYVRVEDFTLSCPAYSQFDLVTIPSLCGLPIIQPSDLYACDDISNDGFELFDLTVQDVVVLGSLNPSNYTISYHTSQAGADDISGTVDLASPATAFNGTNQVIYVRVEDNSDPTVFATTTFNLVVNSTPVADAPADVTVCDSYVLPALTVGNYYTGPGGTGTMLNATNVITTTQLLYVYAETATTPNCTDENSFTVTINTTPVADAPVDVTACDSYVLPALTVGNYYTGPGGTGSMLNATDVITTTQVIYVYAESGTTLNCTDENSFTITINTTPVADAPADVTACDSYVLPALTVGNYYTGPGGTGSMLNATDVITTTQVIYVYAETGTTPNCTDENSFTVTVNPTPVADAPADVTVCDSYVLPALTVGNYYTGPGGTGSMLNATDVITTTQVIYVYAETATTPNCTDENSFTVAINTTPVADAPADVTVCDSYVLPALTVGNYYTGPGGTGSMLNATDVITTTQVIYVYAETGTTPNCTDENSFTVTVNPTPVADAPVDVTSCDSYVLPALTLGNYYTGPGGTGTMLASGTSITTTQVIYVYAETATTPNCTDENSFTVTIIPGVTADAPADVTACDSYVLPALTSGNYYTGPGGTGSMLNATDVITTTQVIYVYAETATTPNCTDENSFTVTVNPTPIADVPVDVTVCDSYVLPALTVGNYYTGPGGTGTQLNATDVITSTQVIYVYAETATTPNCTDENSFTVTIIPGVTADAPADVTACDSYVLPALTVGNYYTGPGGTGTQLNATDVITTTQVIYVYAETGTTPNCTDENSFIVTINTTPVADAPVDVTVCDSYVLPALTVGNYYTGPGGTGTMLASGTSITTTQVIYVYAETATTPNCTDENSFTVTVNPTPVADAPADVTACDSYVLPVLTVGNYYTGPGGTGTMIASGTTITTTQLLYVYAETGTTPNCTDENSFTVTINTTPVADTPADVTVCDSYVLPALTVGNYYTGSGGTGTQLNATDVITTTQVVYVYAETATTPNCTDENSFTVTVNPTPVADAPADVTVCDSYVLPALTVGNYYTGPGGTGTMIASGTTITTTQLLYVYAETATTPNCTDENSFTVTINTTPVADAPADVTVCDSYVLPALAVGNYYTGPGGTGTQLNATDVITTTQVIYVYADSGTTPNCTDENSFTVTVNPTPVADAPADVTVCDSYILPALTVGNYYTGPGGTGTMLASGTSITTTQLLYVYAETATTPNCTDENSFTVTVNQTPQLISLVANGPICAGQDAVFTITGTAGAQVDFTLNSVSQNTIIPASGIATIVVTGATTSQTIVLSQIQDTVSFCSATLTNTATVSVIALPTASIDAQSNAVCFNRTTTLLFTGTPNATVSFTDGAATYSVTLDGSGSANFTTPSLTVNTTYSITSVATATTPSCSQVVTDSETITINPTPTITSVTYTSTICSGTMTDFVVNLNNTTSYVWSATITNIDNTTYVQSGDQTNINQAATLQNGLDVGYITMQITPVLAGSSCSGTAQQFVVTVTPVPVITDIVESSLLVCSSDSVQVSITGNLANINYNWVAVLNGVIVSSGVTSGTTTGTIDLPVEVSDVTQPGDLYFEITPVLGSCTGQMQTSEVITVSPIPGAVVSSPDVAICSGELVADAIDIQVGYPNLAGTTVEWIVQSVTGVSGATSGSASASPFEIPDTLTTTSNAQGVVVYRVWTVSSSGCRGAYTDFTIYVNPLPQPVLQDGSICVELATSLVFQSHLLDSGIPNTADYQFTWYYDGNVIGAATQSTYEAEQAGDYYVLVQNTLTNCENISNIVSVTEINNATDFTYTVTNAFTDNATVTITVVDGNGSFLYQLDDQDLQESSEFTGVSAGTHQLTVVDQKGCTYLTKEIFIIDYPKFFTPNGDGYNDYWNIFTLRDQPNAKIYIFDRYGKLIKQISPLSEGWDGTYNSEQLPATDYWFTVEYQENQQNKVFKAHFSLKR